MRKLTLDCSQISTKIGLHLQLTELLDLPEYYGNNLDALFDALGDIAEDLNIVFMEDEEGSCGEWVVDGSSSVRSDEMDRLLKNVRRVIEDAAEENSHLHV